LYEKVKFNLFNFNYSNLAFSIKNINSKNNYILKELSKSIAAFDQRQFSNVTTNK
jgi:hypothetical protein